MGTSRIITESIAAEFILCPNLCWQQRLINVHVSKQIQQEPAQGRKVLVEKMQQNESCIKLIMYLFYEKCGKIKQLQPFQKKTTWKTTSTEWTGTSRITTKKRCSRIIQSVRKFLLTTNADNCFKLLSICPDCTLQVLTLFVAQISTPMLLYCALHWLCSIPSETTGSLQISHENIRSLMLLHVIEAWKPLQVTIVNLHIFSEKKTLVQNRSKILTTNCSFDFCLDPTGLQNSTATICFCTTSQRTIKT
jgi:hypothetical protein